MATLGFKQIAQPHRVISGGRKSQHISCRLSSIYQSSIDLQQSFHFNFKSKFYQYGEAARQSVLQQNSIDNIKDLESQFKQYDGYIFRDAPTKIQTDSRVVVVGDVHGDMQKLLQSLLLAKVIEVKHNKIIWTGEDTIVIQLGDVLDRGNTEIGILVLLRRLDIQAKFTGGAVYMLNGNHEVMNAHSQFRSVSLDGYRECCSLLDSSSENEKCGPQWYEARNYMFSRGGPIARELSRNPTTLSINNILFAHGGVLPQHCEFGLENLNYEVSQWFNGHDVSESSCVQRLQSALQGANSIVWNRDYSMPCTSTAQRLEALEGLDKVLKSEEAEYMVIGHTPQKQGANNAFGGKIWRMDVGMSNGIFGTDPQVLEINWDYNGKTNFNLLKWTPDMEIAYKNRQEDESATMQCLEDSECVLETQRPVISGNLTYQESDLKHSLAQQRSLAYV